MKPSAKVFVVDDDAAVLKSVEAILTSRGYSAKCFSSAELFLVEHHPSQVGCVLIDLSMPGMNGSELLRRIQESGSLLSVIVISGWIDGLVHEIQENEQVPTLTKPYEIATLLQMVEDGIAGSVRRRNVFRNRKRRG